MYVCARLPAFLCFPPIAFFSHFPTPPCSDALTIFLLVSVSSAVAPVPRPPNLLPPQPSQLLFSSCSCLPEHSLLSHSRYLTPCSLSHLCIILYLFLQSPWAPAHTNTFFLLVSFLLLLPPAFSSMAFSLFIYSLCFSLSALPPFLPHHSYPCTYGNTHSIGCTVNKSEGIAGTCQPLPTSSCYTQAAVMTEPCKEGLHTLVLFKTLHVWKSYLLNSRFHDHCAKNQKQGGCYRDKVCTWQKLYITFHRCLLLISSLLWVYTTLALCLGRSEIKTSMCSQ